jgi:hypothetical protein
MTIRLLAAVFAICLAPFAVCGADDENPYKGVKKGDFATYKIKAKVGPFEIEGTTTQSVIAASDKEVKIKVTANVNGVEAPPQEQTIDLTKPYDPTKIGGLPGGAEGTVEKGKDGKEDIMLGKMKYATTWTTYKVKGKVMGAEIEANLKVWMSKDVKMGIVKTEGTATIMDKEVKMTMELSESGNKP